MTMSKDRRDREYDKFVEKDGETAVRVDTDLKQSQEYSSEELLGRMDKLISLFEVSNELSQHRFLQDGTGDKYRSKVTSRGQLVTSPLEFSTIYFNNLTVNNQAYNIVPPISGKQFVITDIIIGGDRNVGVNGSTTIIYESDAADSLTEDKVLLELEIQKQSTVPLTGLNLITNPGKWLNIKQTDNNVFANIAGYYVSIEE